MRTFAKHFSYPELTDFICAFYYLIFGRFYMKATLAFFNTSEAKKNCVCFLLEWWGNLNGCCACEYMHFYNACAWGMFIAILLILELTYSFQASYKYCYQCIMLHRKKVGLRMNSISERFSWSTAFGRVKKLNLKYSIRAILEQCQVSIFRKRVIYIKKNRKLFE